MRGVVCVKLLVISGSTCCAGDIILAVNGHSVDLESVDIVLSGLSDEVYINTSLVPRPHTLWFVCGESLGIRLSIQCVVYMSLASFPSSRTRAWERGRLPQNLWQLRACTPSCPDVPMYEAMWLIFHRLLYCRWCSPSTSS